MLKKIFTVSALLLMIFAFSSCSIKNDSGKKQTQEYSFTQKETVIHNYFKEKLPDYKFDNVPVERYKDGVNYTLSVTCSQKDFGKYVKKLKDSGFEQNAFEAETYFSAKTEDGYYVEATYVGDMLTVFIKKV